MKKTFLTFLLALLPALAFAGNTPSYTDVASVNDSDLFLDWQSSKQYSVTALQFKAYCLTGLAPAWSSLVGKPTTLAGYGITDANNGVTTESISAASTVTLASQGRVSFDTITLGAGTGAYTANRPLSDSGARAGDEWFINVSWPTSINPTLSFFDSTTSGTALGSYVSTANGGSSTLQFVFNGTSWVHLSKGEVPTRMLGANVYTAMQAALEGANGLWALNSSGNFPSFTLDPSATFTIPSGATLVVNGTLVTTLKQRYFTTTTLEQAYVLAQGELGMAGDTGLLYIGDGSTAGGSLVNFSPKIVSGSPSPLTMTGPGSSSNSGAAFTLQSGQGSGFGNQAGTFNLFGGTGVSSSNGGTVDVEGGSGASNGSVNLGTNSAKTGGVNVGNTVGQTYITGSAIFFSGPTSLGPVNIFNYSPAALTTNATLNPGNVYTANSSSRLVFTLPSTAAAGSVETVFGLGSGGWKIAQPAGVQVVMSGNTVGTNATTVGTSGYVQSANQYDSIILVCIVANTTWEVIGGHGAYTFN